MKCIIIIYICRNKFAGYLGWPNKCWMLCNKHIPSSPGCPLADAAQGTVLAFWLQGCAADSRYIFSSACLLLPLMADYPNRINLNLCSSSSSPTSERYLSTSGRVGGCLVRKGKCSCTTLSYIIGKKYRKNYFVD